MATKISDEIDRKESDKENFQYSAVLNDPPSGPLRSNSKLLQTLLLYLSSPTRSIRKLLRSCMTWLHKIPFGGETVRSILPLVHHGNECDDDNYGDDKDMYRLLRAPILTSHLSNTSLDCISTIMNDIEYSEQLSKHEDNHGLDQDHNNAVSQPASHFSTSKESLSLQTIYDGEIFGRDYGSIGAEEKADTQR